MRDLQKGGCCCLALPSRESALKLVLDAVGQSVPCLTYKKVGAAPDSVAAGTRCSCAARRAAAVAALPPVLLLLLLLLLLLKLLLQAPGRYTSCFTFHPACAVDCLPAQRPVVRVCVRRRCLC